MFNVHLFKQEKIDGFTSKDLSKALSYIVPVEVNPNFDIKSAQESVLNFCKTVASENQDAILFPFKSVLVSTILNGNYDYFDKEEVWAAKASPAHKPVNFEHEESDIIGHMISALAVDDNAKELSDDLSLDELPDKYHIVSSAVLYKHWSDKNKQERMNKIIEEIPQNLWFVSVECLFPKFDYILTKESGDYKIVARTEQTSFLTKCLRCYGGKGRHEKYPEYEIGRVPRNLIFSGKGLVKKPANPESIILAKKYDLISESKIVGYNKQLDKTEVKIEVNKMDEKEFKVQLDALKAENAKLQASLQETNVKEFKVEIDNLKKLVAEKDAKVVSVEALLNTAKDELKASQDKFAETDKARKDLAEKFAKIEADKKVSDRLALVASKLKLDEAKSKKLVETLSVLSDEAFASHIEMQAEILKGNQTEVVTEKTEKTEGSKADEKVLETVEKDEKAVASVVTKTEDNGVEKTRASIAAYITNYVGESEKK